MKRMFCTTMVLMLLSAPPALAGDKEELKPSDSDAFSALDAGKNKNPKGATLDGAVGTFDRALAKYESGELEATRSNLEYNRGRLTSLKKQEATQAEYVRTFWEHVAVYFENLRKQYGNDEKDPAYRKAVISLREEYQQQESRAKAELQRLRVEITRTTSRIGELENRLRIAKLQKEMRSKTLGAKPTAKSNKEASPSRGGEAIRFMNGLSERKSEVRLTRLLTAVKPKSAVNIYYKELSKRIKEGD